jgi:voltage-gated potassium channel
LEKRFRFLTSLLCFSFVIANSIFWFSENGINNKINSFVDVIWWWITTSTTVGYGDIIPITLAGKLAATITIITGIYFYTNFITFTADKIHFLLDKHKRGTVSVTCKNHIVICEYTAFADELIQEIDQYPFLRDRELVVVTDLVETNPYPQHHFVRGVPINPDFLVMANIQFADFIFVFANARFQEPDLKTLHILSRIQKINSQAKIFVELKDTESELADYLDNSIIKMNSRQLLKSVLKEKSLHLETYFLNDLKESQPVT